ncbi:MAG: DUF4111 domain-containing protein [Ktedonobacteraceae bacterium]|nr:DUF4111 domain-containing protein [Ktedonobacteraceae bacterium]MBO0790807.1 DUF4111 domain-containing protein [Ktedonobacteraceae bacterium]
MQTEPTPYAHINALLAQLLAGMRTILGPKLVGLYLYGSLVTGDFDHEQSDLDLLAATASDLDEKECNALKKMHQDFASQHKQWDDRVEVAYLSVAALRTFRTRVSNIGIISPGEPFHVKEAGKDWLLNWYIVREKGMVLAGPAPQQIIDPIARAEYLQVVRDHTQWWRDHVKQCHHRKAQAYAILTLCRALYSLKTGEVASKKRAAEWVAQELPEWSTAIQDALAWRAAANDEHVDHAATLPQTQRFVHAMIDQCEQC